MQEREIAIAIRDENANEIVSESEAESSGRPPRASDFAHRVYRETYAGAAKVEAVNRQTFQQHVCSHGVCSWPPAAP
jgi:hypothetical protein